MISEVPCGPANQWEPVPERVRIVSLFYHVRWPSHPSVFSGSGRAARFGWCGNKAAEGSDTGGKEALCVEVVTQREYVYVYVCVCVCVVVTFSRLGINRVWLPILLVVS